MAGAQTIQSAKIIGGKHVEVMDEKEIKIVKNSTIYEIRLAFASGVKEDY